MSHSGNVLQEAYAAFNSRNIDAALQRMTDDVSWPKASEGGRVVGKNELRAYWTRQWAEFDPHVEPLNILEDGADRAQVRVHQVVKDLGGKLLSDSEVWHRYTLVHGLISRMDLHGPEVELEGKAPSQHGPSTAFQKP